MIDGLSEQLDEVLDYVFWQIEIRHKIIKSQKDIMRTLYFILDDANKQSKEDQKKARNILKLIRENEVLKM